MTSISRSYLLSDLSWVEVRTHMDRDRRLIVPVGVCDQFGPHLPIGTGTLIAESVARELSQDFGVLRAPTFPYGVTVPSERRYPGTTSLREKTLHRVLNDLLASWEDHGFNEFILLTAHNYDPHVEAIATVTGTSSRIRVIEIMSIDFSDLLEAASAAQHGGEIATSLMLYLYPGKVNMDRVQDYATERAAGDHAARLSRLPLGSPGSMGLPSLATAAKGRRIYQRIVQKIRSRIFLASPTDD